MSQDLGRSTRAYRRVVGAIHLLGITAYAVPWLSGLSGTTRIGAAGAVLLLGVIFAIWTARSRRPTVVSVLGAFLTAAAISLGPTIAAAGMPDAVLLLTPKTGITFAIAFAFGVVLARPAVWGCAYLQVPSLAAADRSGARAGLWLVLVASPPLAFAAYLFRAAPQDAEPTFGLVTAASIVLFGLIVSLTGAVRARSRARWLEQVRRGEIPGYRLRPRMPSDPALVAYDDVASVQSSAVLEECVRASLFAEETGRAIALAPCSER